MPRKPRLHVSGGLYHVILRGNNGQNVFHDDAGRRSFLDLLSEGTRRFGYRVHAFCLMTNHVHLALQAGPEPIAKAMQNVGFRHSLRTNRSRGWTGHLFQGRYHAILVERESHVVELVRYVHLNPARAGMVTDPVHYRWSGHRAYLGIDSWSFLTTSWILGLFSESEPLARQRYSDFVFEGLRADERDAVPEGSAAELRFGVLPSGPLGAPAPDRDPVPSEDDLARAAQGAIVLEPSPIPLDDVMRAVCELGGTTEERLSSGRRFRLESGLRTAVAWAAVRFRSASLVEVASRLCRDPSTLCIAVGRLAARAERDAATRALLDGISDRLGRERPEAFPRPARGEFSDILPNKQIPK